MYINEEVITAVEAADRNVKQVVTKTVVTTDEKIKVQGDIKSQRSAVWRHQEIVAGKVHIRRGPSGTRVEKIVQTQTLKRSGEWEDFGWKASAADEESVKAIFPPML
jgi:phage terminase small subunit